MSPLLILALLVALLGFVLLLKPELIWRRFQKGKEAALPGTYAALMRLAGIGALFLSAALAGQV